MAILKVLFHSKIAKSWKDNWENLSHDAHDANGKGYNLKELEQEDRRNGGFSQDNRETAVFGCEDFCTFICSRMVISKQHQAEKMEMTAVSLEAMLGDKTAEQTLWQKVKSFVSGLFKKRSFFELNDFQLVSDQGYPKNQTICIYVWKDKNEQLSWQTGIYNQKLKQFSVRYGASVYSIKQDKVIAWKKMNADAVALEIEDNRN